MPTASRAGAFARAWSEHEGKLKCLGLRLTEWGAADATWLEVCVCQEVALPIGYVGTVADQAPT